MGKYIEHAVSRGKLTNCFQRNWRSLVPIYLSQHRLVFRRKSHTYEGVAGIVQLSYIFIATTSRLRKNVKIISGPIYERDGQNG